MLPGLSYPPKNDQSLSAKKSTSIDVFSTRFQIPSNLSSIFSRPGILMPTHKQTLAKGYEFVLMI